MGTQDISEALREFEQNWRSLAENVPEIVMTIKPDGTISFINRTVPPFTPEKTIGTSVFDYVPPQYQAILRDALERVVQTGESYSCELGGSGPGGRTSWYWSHLVPIKKDGQVVAMTLVARDLTERKQADDQLKRSENKYRTLLENLPQKIFLKDRNSVYISCNENYARDMKIKAEEIAGKTDFDFYCEELAEKYRADDKRIMESGQTEDIEEKYIQNGQEFIVHTVKTPVRDDQGNVTGVLGIFHDITKQKRLERALVESENMHRALVEQIPAITYIAALDEASTTTYVSPQFEQFLGFSPADYKADPDIWRKQLHPDDRQRVFDEIRKCHEKSEPFSCEYRMLTKNGQIVWFRDEARIIKDDNGKPLYLQGVMSDLTRRKEIEQALKESERRYRALFDNSPAGVGLASLDGKVLAFNNTLLNMTGYSKAEIWQINLKDTYVDPQERSNLVEKLRANGLVQNFVVQLKRKDGSTYWASITSNMFDQAGQKVFLTVIIDVTEQKKARDEIRKLTSAIEQSIDGIAIADLEPRLLYVNKAYAQMHGFYPDEMIGMPVAKLHNREQMDVFKAGVHQIKTQGSVETETGHIKKDGTPFPVYMSATLLKDDDGQPNSILAVARDITEKKEREKELSLYREKMVRIEHLASLGTLSATTAHELSQPLTTIRLSIENFLAQLEIKRYPAAEIERLKYCLAEVEHITSIARRFRNFARQSSEKILTEINVEAAADKIVQLLNNDARQARLNVRLDGIDKLPPIYSQEEDLEQLFFVMFENAIQAADGHRDRQLIISGAVEDEYIELRFSDDCGGIAPENLNRIFEPFFTTKPPGKGTGLGLYVVRHIVSSAGGKVWVESRHGKGSTFFVVLPINKNCEVPTQ